MNIEEIFLHLVTHMASGVKLHEQFVTIYSFLNLKGYKKCHQYHCYEEYYNYIKLKEFYTCNYNKILSMVENKIDDIIPQSWYKHIKSDVDASTKRSAIKDMVKKWVEWEQETKQLLSNSYKELYNNDEIYASTEILRLLNEVSKELFQAQELQINLESHGYDLSVIIPEQEQIYKKYHKKLKQIYEDDE